MIKAFSKAKSFSGTILGLNGKVLVERVASVSRALQLPPVRAELAPAGSIRDLLLARAGRDSGRAD